MLQVLALEYETLRAELIMRLSSKYQFYGFFTAAAALIGVAIGYSTGLKVWVLIGLAAAVLVAGIFGYHRMVINGRRISARIALIEERINKLVPAEPGAPNLLGWESEHRPWQPVQLSRDDLGTLALSARPPSGRARPRTTRRLPTTW